MKKIFAIIGSASENSSNEKLVSEIIRQTGDVFNVSVFNELKSLPHFDPMLSGTNPPQVILNFRKRIEQADGIIISTPEYIFSIPSGLKNAIEWCVATTIFTDKPLGIITASASGAKGHEELQMIMKTVMAKFTNDTTLLINGIKRKINEAGAITDEATKNQLSKFVEAFRELVLEEE